MVHAVIMAGGSGTRFWPMSTRSNPKQFHRLFGSGTMLQNTAKRIEPIISQDRLMVVTNERYCDVVAEQLPKMPTNQIIGEPVAKNTAPCVAIAAALLHHKDPDAIMVVLPADHHITDEEGFIAILEQAIEAAEKEEVLVTIGITPSFPETGFGYIESEKGAMESSARKVLAFKEKPDLATAEKFLASGNYYWNSGMFVWKASTVLKAIAQHLPGMYELLEQVKPEFGTSMEPLAIKDFYMDTESISIDYGIMESSENVLVVPGDFGWNDVGSWSAVYELTDKDTSGNALQSIYHTVAGSSNNLLMSSGEKMIALVGMENTAVIETEDSILICNLNHSQGVKQVVEHLSSRDDLKKFS
ncbi:MAG: mannose-1-phosphate guanylyltransferase [Bacteroidetes bacterium]|nr:mannose-1-phosphate guanylyltransferase [Bacteroidota bacterium]